MEVGLTVNIAAAREDGESQRLAANRERKNTGRRVNVEEVLIGLVRDGGGQS